MIARLFVAECVKLRRSLILLLIAGMPLMMLIVVTALNLNRKAAPEWSMLAMGGGAIWAYFLLPMTATALTALLAYIEHAPRAWSTMLALPCPKWQVFAVKAMLAIVLMALISALLWIAILLAGLAVGVLAPQLAPNGELPAGLLAGLLARMWLAGLLALAIQFLVAHAMTNFAAPVVVGIAGTFVAVVASSSDAGIYFPWLLPTNILASDPARAAQALWSGTLGGALLFVAACAWLARRDWH